MCEVETTPCVKVTRQALPAHTHPEQAQEVPNDPGSPSFNTPLCLRRYAYLEFLEADAVKTAEALTGTELHGRAIKVTAQLKPLMNC